jgi:hypothetical protein
MASMLHADTVVWNDLEQWSRKGRTHRAAIQGEPGLQWINIPIKTKDKKKAIREVRIDHSEDWIEPFWNALLHNYSNATWFDFFAEELEADIQTFQQFEKLIDLDLWFFGRLSSYLEFDINFHLASQISNFEPDPDHFKKTMGAEILYQEHDAKNYQWLSNDSEQALEEHPVCQQLGTEFIPGLSILDLLFNHGKESFKIFEKL